MISEKIDVFMDVGQELNFSAVAKKRYTTQPTISRQIADLEHEWGMQLFERSNKGLRLTPEGAIMLNCCRKMDQQMDVAFKQARELQVSRRDRLRLGFLTDINVEEIFMPAIASFAEEYAELDISLSFGSFGDLRSGIHTNRLDIVFTYDFDLSNYRDDVVVDHIREMKPCLVVSEQHPLYQEENLSVSDLSEEVFYLPEEADSPGRERDLFYILRAYQISESKVRFVPNQESALLQARLGRGVAMAEADSEQIRTYGLRIIPFEKGGSPEQMALAAVWKRDNLNPFLADFINRFQSEK